MYQKFECLFNGVYKDFGLKNDVVEYFILSLTQNNFNLLLKPSAEQDKFEMKNKEKEILFVATFYDALILENEVLFRAVYGQNLSVQLSNMNIKQGYRTHSLGTIILGFSSMIFLTILNFLISYA